MKPDTIREMGVEELKSKRTELQEQIFRLRLQKSVGQLDNALKLRLAQQMVQDRGLAAAKKAGEHRHRNRRMLRNASHCRASRS